ncbi:hypothetical protein [Levilactobacillus senmaizukei]|uniref:hypothetical protein n=1 Tax=Levilactobacillus senmaizukei TaxID=431273 RepID=UPI000AC1D6CF|nr:hypothetical protein [Levilactobacillus senmaizukei]
MKRIIPGLLGVIVVGGIVIYQQMRHLPLVIMLETGVLGIGVVFSLLHIISVWRNRH